MAKDRNGVELKEGMLVEYYAGQGVVVCASCRRSEGYICIRALWTDSIWPAGCSKKKALNGYVLAPNHVKAVTDEEEEKYYSTITAVSF